MAQWSIRRAAVLSGDTNRMPLYRRKFRAQHLCPVTTPGNRTPPAAILNTCTRLYNVDGDIRKGQAPFPVAFCLIFVSILLTLMSVVIATTLSKLLRRCSSSGPRSCRRTQRKHSNVDGRRRFSPYTANVPRFAQGSEKVIISRITLCSRGLQRH